MTTNDTAPHRAGRGRRPALARALPFLFLALVALAGCQVDLANPPRLATRAALESATPTPPAAPLYLPAPTATPSPDGAPDTSELPAPDEIAQLVIWVDEESAAHTDALAEMAAEFSAQYPADVAIQQVSAAFLPELVNTAVLSGTLPDVIIHPLEYSVGWAERGILDGAAADEVVTDLGRDTFDAGALDLLASDGVTTAIPSDGYHQLLLYRSDWFEERGLARPDTYDAMRAAAERIYDREAIISGLVIPTESNLVTTHQAFEQLALANGCELISPEGEVTLLSPACRDALDHYFQTINQFSPPGVQTDTSARNALLAGRTGMIITSPAILPDLAGLNSAAAPSCDECAAGDGVNYLARNTGILTQIRGSGPDARDAAFGNLTNLGITTTADREAAQAFARYWFTDGYERWLAVDSERKVPMRRGTADAPTQFIDAWGTRPLAGSDLSLTDIYGADVVARLRDGVATTDRWGFSEGYGDLVTALYEDYTFSIVLQEMLSGYFDVDTTLREAYRRVVDHIPNYAFPVNLDEPTPVP